MFLFWSPSPESIMFLKALSLAAAAALAAAQPELSSENGNIVARPARMSTLCCVTPALLHKVNEHQLRPSVPCARTSHWPADRITASQQARSHPPTFTLMTLRGG